MLLISCREFWIWWFEAKRPADVFVIQRPNHTAAALSQGVARQSFHCSLLLSLSIGKGLTEQWRLDPAAQPQTLIPSTFKYNKSRSKAYPLEKDRLPKYLIAKRISAFSHHKVQDRKFLLKSSKINHRKRHSFFGRWGNRNISTFSEWLRFRDTRLKVAFWS